MSRSHPKKAVLYLRVSDPRQVENCSLETQERACRDFCERQGWSVVEVFRDEGESAKTADRTQLKRLLAWCRKGRADAVVVYRFSRAARNAADYHTLKAVLHRRGFDLVSVTETRGDSPAEHLLENVIAAVNQFDNEVRAEQCRNGMIQAARQGRWVWRTPLGYRRNAERRVVLDPATAPTLVRAFEQAAAGTPIPEVAQFLAREGIRTRGGRPLPQQYLRRILENPFYRGRLVNTGWQIDVVGEWEPLVSDTLWSLVQRALSGRARPELREKRSKIRPDFPLKRFVRCDRCDRPTTASWSRGRSGYYGYYHCTRCHGFRVRKIDLEAAFLDLLRRLQPNPSAFQLWLDVVKELWSRAHQERLGETEIASRELRKLEGRRDRLIDLALDQILDRSTLQSKLQRIDQEIHEARGRADRSSTHLNGEHALDHSKIFLTRPAIVWPRLSIERQVQLQNLLFPAGLRFVPPKGFGAFRTFCLFRLQDETTK